MQSSDGKPTPTPASALSNDVVPRTVDALVAKHGEASRARAAAGVSQAAVRWRDADGPADAFVAFCLEHFVPAGDGLDTLLLRFERNLEQIRGHFNELVRFLKRPVDLDVEPMGPADLLFAAFSPDSHVVEDLFGTKTAFVALLNFPLPSPEEILAAGGAWDRRRWAEVRLARRFAYRVPADLELKATEAIVRADDYINRYNIRMGRLLTPDGRRPFPPDKRLISHWGLRDELKAQYAQADGLERQRLIARVMQRIVRQEIPAAVIDNPDVDWTVETNAVAPATDGAPAPSAARENDVRYLRWLEVFRAMRALDPHYPDAATHVDRRFKLYREIPEADVARLLESVLRSPVFADVAALVRQRLGRPLEPFDIWYDGFKARGAIDETQLDETVRGRFPTLDAFQAALPDTLGRLGFAADTARFLADHIVVEPARGAGHAWGAERREDRAHLRTRVPRGGLDYKGFNIAMHELGHSVEQVFSLARVDHTLLSGVPNTAFTEGFAFVFQSRDLDILGFDRGDPNAGHLAALDTFWATAEIGGVALVDMGVWRWMYAHPDAEPAALREAVLTIARDVWNRYFATAFGVRDVDLLAIYSHMVDGAMYLPDYPLGHIIAFQIEQYFHGRKLAEEMERMCRLGSVSPQTWMQAAVGAPISAQPLIDAAGRAVEALAGR